MSVPYLTNQPLYTTTIQSEKPSWRRWFLTRDRLLRTFQQPGRLPVRTIALPVGPAAPVTEDPFLSWIGLRGPMNNTQLHQLPPAPLLIGPLPGPQRAAGRGLRPAYPMSEMGNRSFFHGVENV